MLPPRSWLARTDPADVARVESKTVICTERQRETVPIPQDGVKGQLGIWMSPQELTKQFSQRFPGCMKGEHTVLIIKTDDGNTTCNSDNMYEARFCVVLL